MSERTIQENQDKILKTALKEMERNRDIVTGRIFRKYYQLPWSPFWLMLPYIPLFSIILILALFDFPTRYEFIPLMIVLGIWGSGLTFTILAIGNINKRIDKIVELTGAETKLEEKYYSNVKIITGSYSEKGNS